MKIFVCSVRASSKLVRRITRVTKISFFLYNLAGHSRAPIIAASEDVNVVRLAATAGAAVVVSLERMSVRVHAAARLATVVRAARRRRAHCVRVEAVLVFDALV